MNDTDEVCMNCPLFKGGQKRCSSKDTSSKLNNLELPCSFEMQGDENITFIELFDLNELQKIQDTFAEATGVASIITDPEGVPITKPSNFCRLCNDIIRKTEKGRANCYYSDSMIGRPNPDGPIIQPCLSGGLWDAGSSISIKGKHIANWLIGQVKNKDTKEEKMMEYAREIGADEDEFREALHEVREMSLEQFQKIADALFVFAREISSKAYLNKQQERFISYQT